MCCFIKGIQKCTKSFLTVTKTTILSTLKGLSTLNPFLGCCVTFMTQYLVASECL